MFEGFPYTNFHELNLDWIVKIAKDFLDQYTHIQEIIEQGEESITELSQEKLDALNDKYTEISGLLDSWYETHSQDIADVLADALNDLGAYVTSAEGQMQTAETNILTDFNTRAQAKANETIESIPADYTSLSDEVVELVNGLNVRVVKNALINNSLVEKDMTSVSATEICSYAVLEFDLNSDLLLEVSGFNYKSNGTGVYDRAGYFFLDGSNQLVSKYVTPDNAPFHTVVKTPHSAKKLIVNGVVGQGQTINDSRPLIKVYDYPAVSVYHNNCVIKTTGAIWDLSSFIETYNQYYSFMEMVFVPGENNYFNIRGTDYQTGANQYAGYTFYDETDTIVERITATNTQFELIVHAPATACKVVVNGMVDTAQGTYNAAFVEFVNRKDMVNPALLQGKKIVWFGTSIPEGYYTGGKSYPQLVADRLGAYLYNESIGSSAMSAYPNNICRVKNLAMTYAEKQVQSWWNDLSDADKILGMNSSFDHVVSKYLTGGSVGQVDIYVFDHVYNDYDKNNTTDFDTEPDNPYDKNYPLGAAHFLIQSILNDNPHAIILWIGHYEGKLLDPNNKQSWGKPVVELQKKICEDHQIPLCPLWEYTGWGNPNKVTTTGYWDNGQWHGSGGTSRQDYVKNCAFPDGIHPWSDSSGDATNKIADIITSWFKSIM